MKVEFEVVRNDPESQEYTVEVAGYFDSREKATSLAAELNAREAELAELQAATGNRTPSLVSKLIEQAKQGAELFCWCVESLNRFPPQEGEWHDDIKRRLNEAVALQDERDQLRAYAECEEAATAYREDYRSESVKLPIFEAVLKKHGYPDGEWDCPAFIRDLRTTALSAKGEGANE